MSLPTRTLPRSPARTPRLSPLLAPPLAHLPTPLLATLLALSLAAPGRAQTLGNRDDCADGVLDVVGPGSYAVDTSTASTGAEGQNEALCDQGQGSAIVDDVWFVYEPTADGLLTVAGCGFGPTQGAKVALYPGTACPQDGTALGCDGQSCPAQGGGALLTVAVSFGQSYLVQVGTTGGFPFTSTLHLIESPGQVYCAAQPPNSTGSVGELSAFASSARVADDDFTLTATNVPGGQFGYFLVGDATQQVVPPGSQGFLCLAGTLGRFTAPGQILDGPGSIEVDLLALPTNPTSAVQPGETWNFQFWHRDVGGTSLFTNALAVTFS